MNNINGPSSFLALRRKACIMGQFNCIDNNGCIGGNKFLNHADVSQYLESEEQHR